MSYTALRYHIIFSTKERRAFLQPDVRARLTPFLGGIIRNLGGAAIEINGAEDHIHVVTSFPARIAISDAVRDLKCNSSGWIHETDPNLRTFAWQDEYAAFSVSPGNISPLIAYVRNQGEHHKTTTFIDELKWFLRGYGIPFEDKYLYVCRPFGAPI